MACEAEKKTEWAIFGPSFWDEETLVASASDGRFIYPSREFDPQAGQYYYLNLKEKISQRTQRPYYVGYPLHGGVIKPPQEFVQLLERIQKLEATLEVLSAEKHEWIEAMVDLEDENLALREEITALRVRLAKHQRAAAAEDVPQIKPTQQTIAALLKDCSIKDLLGEHSTQRQQKVYRQMMQRIHPDKTREWGAVTTLILGELAKSINTRYH